MKEIQALPREAFLRQRWDRIGLGVRLAYNPWHPGVIRCYLQAGALLVRIGAMPELAVQQRMLQVLLQTAADPGLPWAWRSACHEHMVFPLARLATLARLGLAPAATPWQQRVDACAALLERCRPGACGRKRRP
ncbi:MAG: hypothetical protein QM750_17495 [Rubrivivax sp.]